MMYRKLGLAFLFCVLSGKLQASSSVGTGGSILRANIMEARNIAAKVAAKVIEEARENDVIYEDLCQRERRRKGHGLIVQQQVLAEDKRLFCALFAKEALPQMLNMVTQQPLVDFEMSQDLAIDGKQVDAMVEGPERKFPVIFNIRTNTFFTPEQLLFLWFHELGHKVVFKDVSPTDNDPFFDFTKGSLLLDTLASGLAFYASKKGMIHKSFTVLDYFKCTYEIDRLKDDSDKAAEGSTRKKWPVFEFTGASARLFDDPKVSLESYRAGFDMENKYWSVKISDPDADGNDLILKLIILESNGCREGEGVRRSSTLQLFSKPKDVDELGEILVHETIPENITCKGQETKTLMLKHNDLTFTCGFEKTRVIAVNPSREARQIVTGRK